MKEKGLFANSSKVDSFTPLADRMRPCDITEFVGQEEIIGKDKPLREIIVSKKIPSMIFWGPPGSGKTTLAKIIATATGYPFVSFSAVTSGIKEIKSVMDLARLKRNINQQPTILFVDEVHRFNRAQQDAFLPYVENGTIIFIGATTENPSFEVISALLSRCRVFVLKQLREDEIKIIIERALSDNERGLGHYKVKVEEGGIDFVCNISNGDARIALNLLEMATFATQVNSDGIRFITLKTLRDSAQKRIKLYDTNREEHYNIISAFHKSLRGSDPDAALYYLARMLESGEDPLYVARRMVRFASEDIGNADPQALVLAVSAKDAVDFVGMPECNLALAQVALYLACAPKSNATYLAYASAASDVENTQNLPVPLHLRNPVTDLMKGIGYGKGYKYAHSFPSAIDNLEYMPENLKGKKYYYPKEMGFEVELKKRLDYIRRRKGELKRQKNEGKGG